MEKTCAAELGFCEFDCLEKADGPVLTEGGMLAQGFHCPEKSIHLDSLVSLVIVLKQYEESLNIPGPDGSILSVHEGSIPLWTWEKWYRRGTGIYSLRIPDLARLLGRTDLAAQ